MNAADVRARVLGIPDDGRHVIVLVDRNEAIAKNWLRQSRQLFGGVLRFRLYERAVSAEGLRTMVYVVTGWRAVPGLRG